MAAFQYIARDQLGDRVTGTLTAVTRRAVLIELCSDNRFSLKELTIGVFE